MKNQSITYKLNKKKLISLIFAETECIKRSSVLPHSIELMLKYMMDNNITIAVEAVYETKISILKITRLYFDHTQQTIVGA